MQSFEVDLGMDHTEMFKSWSYFSKKGIFFNRMHTIVRNEK